jgi:hypothetical protein
MESSGHDGGKDRPGAEDAGTKGVDDASGGGGDAVADDTATETAAAEEADKDPAEGDADGAAASAGEGKGEKSAGKDKPAADGAGGDAPAGKDSKKFRNAAIVGGALVVAGFATGFAGGFISGPGIGTESGEPRTLEQLAAATGCKPAISSNKDFRQGNCQTKRGRFVLMAFTTEQGKQTWLKLAKDYGGVFLVGTRWVIAGTGPDNVTKPMLNEFRDDLGGQIQPGRKHHGGGGGKTHGPK